MAYYRPGDRVGGYPIGSELGEDGPSGLRPGGGYAPQGYGVPSYEYERERPLGGAYAGGAPEYYGAERPGGYGYEREGYGRERYGREGYGREGLVREGLVREGYAPSVYDQAYSRQPQMLVPPPVEYVEAQTSDLGMGLRDTGKVSRQHPTDYGAGYGRRDVAGYGGPEVAGYERREVAGYERPEVAGYGRPEVAGYERPEVAGYGRPEVAGYGRPEVAGYGRPEVAGYGGAPGYGAGMYEEDEVRRLKKELEHERRQKHELELAAGGAALGYGLHERREKKEEKDDDFEPKKEKKRHHFFSRD